MSETKASHSFIDVATWRGVNERFLSGEPLAVFDRDMDQVVWTNGPAARLFGFSSISEFEADSLDGMNAVRRQLKAAAARAVADGEARIMLRIASGMTSRLLPTVLSKIARPDGSTYVAFVAQAGASDREETEAAEAAISGLAEEGAGAAVLGADGEKIAANAMFTDLDMADGVIGALVADAQRTDRPIKRLAETTSGASVAVAIARLSETPDRYLAMAVASAQPVREQAGATADIPADAPVAVPEDVTPEEEIETASATPAEIDETESAEIEAPRAARQEPVAHSRFEADLESRTTPIRFVWKTDAEGRFINISPEFAAAVGPNAADVVGRSFEEVARVFELDPSGEISASLKRRDTWSGKSVLWPVEGTAYCVPVDLAALPSYNRDRTFEGYRGFGIARMGDARPDPEKIGLSLGAPAIPDEAKPTGGQDDTPPAPTSEEFEPRRETEPEANAEAPADPFEGEVPALDTIAPTPMRRETDKVIDLNAKRRSQTVREALNPNEQAAFRHIGEALGWARTRHDDSDDRTEVGRPKEEPEAGIVTDEAAVSDTTTADLETIEPLDIAEGRNEAVAPDMTGEAPVEEPAPAGNDDATTAGIDEVDDHDTPAATDEPETEDEDIHPDYMPSAFATGSDNSAERPGPTPGFLDALPLPVMVHRDDNALFINDAFSELTGYPDADALNAAGGIDALFAGEADADGILSLSGAEGDPISARANIQTISWLGRTAIMFAFEPQEEREEEDAAPTHDGDPVAELRAILDTATDGVVVLSSDGVIRSFNGSAAALFGYSSEEVEGKSFTMLFAQESQPAAINYVHGLANNGVASVLNEGLEVLGREKNGGFLPLFMTIGRLETSNRLCAVVRDITAWKQTEQALLDAQRTAENASSHKTEFLAKISHEIRTPLNAIIGFSELMQEERFGPIGNERYKAYLADINKSGKYVLDLVNDLLDISKIEAGKQELEFESVSLNEAISEAVAMIQPQANRNRIIIRSSLDETLPPVVADARSMKQIALNLLSNSVRFTHSGGQVIINTSYNARGEVVLRIKDTGIGMSAKEIETALQPFQQVASLGRVRGDGTGLGLPLTKALVEANRAEFAIQSEPGRGTAVEVVFPPSRVLAS